MRSNIFRNRALWTPKQNQLYTENLDFLATTHYNLSEPKLTKRIFSIQSAEQLAQGILEVDLKALAAKLKDRRQSVISGDSGPKFTLKLDHRAVRYSYGMSKMTVIDDNFQDKLYFRLVFLEFLEFLARLSL